MIGAKAGQHVALLGAGDGGLAATVALVTGLNGQTRVVDPTPEAAKRVADAAANAGAYVEFEQAPLAMLPLDTESFDIAVVHRALPAGDASPVLSEAAPILSEAARVVREGGRVLVIGDAPRPGVFGAFRRSG